MGMDRHKWRLFFESGLGSRIGGSDGVWDADNGRSVGR